MVDVLSENCKCDTISKKKKVIKEITNTVLKTNMHYGILAYAWDHPINRSTIHGNCF